MIRHQFLSGGANVFRLLLSITLLFLFSVNGAGTTGYLPGSIQYAPEITPPAAYLGYEIGDRHLTHTELVGYLQLLASQSDRIDLVEYGRTHGHRKLLQLIISSPQNLENIDQLRSRHLQLADPAKSHKLNLKKMPVVVNFNYSVHGNESSGANASAIIAYYLAAAQGDPMETFLGNTIILLDPCLNPDGLDRFANWTNSYSGKNPNPDPDTREHVEDWPGGRGNYYFFDLNRDWMLLTQPESVGRMKFFHHWLPNLVLDFHEMGTNSTYFFQPGVPERRHPLISEENAELTKRISHYFADALDTTGSLYFSEERFDDFYMGKGSTISDLKGAVGFLFEQASARGLVQDSVNGQVDFPFSIRNQVTVSLAVLQAAGDLRQELLSHTRNFFKESLRMGKNAKSVGYTFNSPGDPDRARRFAELLRSHQIRVKPLQQDSGWYVPLAQPHYRYLEALTEQRTEFKESIFYDITSWSLPLAYDLKWNAVTNEPDSGDPEPTSADLQKGKIGYLIDWADSGAARLVLDLMEADALVKVAGSPFTLDGDSFGYGTVFVPVPLQDENTGNLYPILKASARKGVRVVPVDTSLTGEGIDLGSNLFRRLEKPSILIVAGEGIQSYSTGEVWHLLDVVNDYPASMVSPSRLPKVDLSSYSTIVLPDTTSDDAYADALVEKLSAWTMAGGTVVCLGDASKWAIEKDLVELTLAGDKTDEEAEPDTDPVERRPFAEASDDKALERIRGAIFQTDVDRSHPLAYGITGETLPVFVNQDFFLARSSNPYQTPMVFSKDPLLAGYASLENLSTMETSAAVVVEPQGQGAVILFGIDPAFRACWKGTEKLLLNAMLFGGFMKE